MILLVKKLGLFVNLYRVISIRTPVLTAIIWMVQPLWRWVTQEYQVYSNPSPLLVYHPDNGCQDQVANAMAGYCKNYLSAPNKLGITTRTRNPT